MTQKEQTISELTGHIARLEKQLKDAGIEPVKRYSEFDWMGMYRAGMGATEMAEAVGCKRPVAYARLKRMDGDRSLEDAVARFHALLGKGIISKIFAVSELPLLSAQTLALHVSRCMWEQEIDEIPTRVWVKLPESIRRKYGSGRQKWRHEEAKRLWSDRAARRAQRESYRLMASEVARYALADLQADLSGMSYSSFPIRFRFQ